MMDIDRLSFGGDVPMTWVRQGDPLWDELSERWAAAPDLETGQPRRRRPPAIFSQHIPAADGPGWFFRTSWISDIRSRQDEWQPKRPTTGSKVANRLLSSTAKITTLEGAQPWLPLKPDKRSDTITAMENRWNRGAVQRHEYDTYAGTLRATAALLGDDADGKRCLELAMIVEEHARLSDDKFVAKAMAWVGAR